MRASPAHVMRYFRSRLEGGVWIVAPTSLNLGNIDIDQAVVSAITNMMAAKVTILLRMTPVRVDQPRRNSFGAFRVARV